MIFESQSGYTLELKPIKNKLALQNLMYNAGLQESLLTEIEKSKDPQKEIKKEFEQLSDKQKIERTQAYSKLFAFCIMSGIDTYPPDSDVKLLQSLGHDTSTKRLVVLEWVRNIVIEGDTEAGELMGMILACSFANEE